MWHGQQLPITFHLVSTLAKTSYPRYVGTPISAVSLLAGPDLRITPRLAHTLMAAVCFDAQGDDCFVWWSLGVGGFQGCATTRPNGQKRNISTEEARTSCASSSWRHGTLSRSWPSWLRHVPRGKHDDLGQCLPHTEVSQLSYGERPKEVRCAPGNAAQAVERGAACG